MPRTHRLCVEPMGTEYAFLHIADQSHRGIKFNMLEQHVDLREANRLRGNSDVSKLTEWFALLHPFPQSHELMSMSTGVVDEHACRQNIQGSHFESEGYRSSSGSRQQLNENMTRDSADQHHATLQQDHICHEV